MNYVPSIFVTDYRLYHELQIGMGDPYVVVFHLPGNFCNFSPQFPGTEIGRGPTITTTEELGVTDKLVKHIMLQIRGYLVDSNVQIIELASRTLKVIIMHNFSLDRCSR